MATGKIGNTPQINPAQIGPPIGAESLKQSNSKNSRSPAKGGEDFNVLLSKEARTKAEAHQKALDIARNTSSIREDRVEKLKKQIKDGTYKVDSGKVADGIMREAIRDHLAETER